MEGRLSEKPDVTPPVLVALLLCDQVIDDRLTNKKSAIGLFNAIVVPTLPTRVPQVSVMATLTEIRTRCPLELRLLRDTDNQMLMRSQGFVDSPGMLAIADLVFSLHGVMFDRAGQYAFELLCDDQLLGRRRFHVVHHPGQRPNAGRGTETQNR